MPIRYTSHEHSLSEELYLGVEQQGEVTLPTLGITFTARKDCTFTHKTHSSISFPTYVHDPVIGKEIRNDALIYQRQGKSEMGFNAGRFRFITTYDENLQGIQRVLIAAHEEAHTLMNSGMGRILKREAKRLGIDDLLSDLDHWDRITQRALNANPELIRDVEDLYDVTKKPAGKRDSIDEIDAEIGGVIGAIKSGYVDPQNARRLALHLIEKAGANSQAYVSSQVRAYHQPSQ